MANTSISLGGRLLRIAKRMIVLAVVVYVALCGILYFEQERLLFPGAQDQGDAQSKITFGTTIHLTTSNGIPIEAVFGSADKPDRPTILYFYGNAGAVAWSEGEFNHFRETGCNVLIPDLAGYGASGGKPSEANFYATADAARNYLQHAPGINPRKIIVVGWSMGAGVAIDLASREPVAGLAIFNAFTTMNDTAHRIMPWAPTGLLLKHRFNNRKKIANIHCPTLVCNGQLDTLIPPSDSDELAATAGGPVTRLIIPTADHNTIFIANPLVWTKFDAWLKSNPVWMERSQR